MTNLDPKRIKVTSDPHFGHQNIIRYCRRPFPNVWEMNQALVRNWNETVSPEDTVYCLGDIGYGRDSGDPLAWLRLLNGRIKLIRGSHDHHIPTHLMMPCELLWIDGVRLYLVHNPYHAPEGFDGWVIHGHLHRKRPFMDFRNRMVNVSVEQTFYRPVSLALIIDLIKGSGEMSNGEFNQRNILERVPTGLPGPSPVYEGANI